MSSYVLNFSPIGKQPRLKFVLSRVRVKAGFRSHPGAHLSDGVGSIDEIVGAGIYVCKGNDSI
jgi:hypothetical protein